MDNRNHIIDTLERAYHVYLNRQSDVLFNSATDYLFDQINNIPICRDIISAIKREYPIDSDVIKENQCKEYFSYIDGVTNNNAYYISYCLHLIDYIREKGIVSPKGYDEKCYWLYSNIRGSKDSMMLFKTDFMRPIIDYIINQLHEEIYILYLLDRFKQRIERFKPIDKIQDKDELFLQKELFLYLFDQGIELGNSSNIGNGEVDFIVDINHKPFVIEVKLYRKDGIYSKYLSQLKDYMSKTSAHWGCLYIFTTEDVCFELENPLKYLFIKTIYIGNKTPSRRNTSVVTLEK